MLNRQLLVIACMLFISSIACAQENLGLSLEDAINYAIENNREVKDANFDVIAAKKRVNEVTGMGLPQVSGSFDYTYYAKIPTTLIPGEAFGEDAGSLIPVSFGLKHNATAGVEASQLIFDGSYIVGLQAARTYRELSRKELEQTEVETKYLVAKAYYNVLVNDERMEMVLANETRLKKLRDDTKALYENGFAEKLDADRLELSYNNILVEKENTKRSLEIGIYLLKFQMGMDYTQEVTLTDKIEDVVLEPISPETEEEAFKQRPEYEVLRVQYELAKLDHRKNNYAYLPQLVGFGSLQTQAQRNEFNIFDSNEQWYSFGLVGAKLSVNIFSGFQRSAKSQQSKITMHKVENGLEAMREGIKLEIAESRSNYSNSLARLEMQKNNKALAEEVVRVTQIKYSEGLGSNLEVTNAETSLRESNSNYYNTLFEAIVAKLDYDKAKGNINK
ncbi:MAG: TolC family protein [Bacteroidia bacterium]|nr:TolC family protein [Bacteroidia bacterium]